MTSTDRAYAQSLDRQDELANFRQRFYSADPRLVYLDGNSLGRLPLNTRSRVKEIVDYEWGSRLIRSWNEGWLDAQVGIGRKIALLLGADPQEVLIADSTSVNLFKLALAALQQQSGRKKIITDNLNFPSDLYILQGICNLLGGEFSLEVTPSSDGIYGPVDRLIAEMDHDTALLTLSHTAFKSSYTYDLETITKAAHDRGALVLWDLSHSAGVVPIDLHQANVDMAVGCTYKYLNGGPGSPAFLYVRQDLQDKLKNPISGWMGHHEMFAFNLEFEPAPGLRRFITGTPPVLSIGAIEPGVDLLLEAGIERIRSKSMALSDYLIYLWETTLQPLGFALNSPRESHLRGSHISLGHEEGYRIDLALINEMDVLPDFRHPDNIRLGLAPLYTSFEDIYTAVSRIREVVTAKLYEKYAPISGIAT